MTITEPGRLLRWTAFVIAGATGLSASAQAKIPADHHLDVTVKGHVFLARGELVGTFKRPESPARP